GTSTTLAQFPVSGFAAHTLTNLSQPSQIPLASPTVGSDPQLKAAATVSPVYSAFSPGVVAPVGSTSNPQSATSMQATISISGQGANQKSKWGVFISDYVMDSTNGTVGVRVPLTELTDSGPISQSGV